MSHDLPLPDAGETTVARCGRRVTRDALSDMLAGKSMDSVSFVDDYIRLGFGDVGMVVTCSIHLVHAGVNLAAADSGFADAMRAQVGKTVRSAGVCGDHEASVLFADGSYLLMFLEHRRDLLRGAMVVSIGDRVLVSR